jgi:quinohemoprotein amine dehydrogenase
MHKKPFSLAAVTALLLGAATTVFGATPEQLISHNCAGCHASPEDASAPYTRMVEQRKSPEGWHMTLERMRHVHRVPFADPDGALAPEEVMRTLIKHLADTQGLAPGEATPYRYILEQRLNTIDVPEDPEFAVMCARCHSPARVGLQRRSEQEWRHLVHFHLAQFPTSEYSAGGRDRDWFGTAIERMVPLLSQRYPFVNAEWTTWQAAPKPELAGRWRLSGRMPGKGDFEAVMSAVALEGDQFTLSLDGSFANGDSLSASGSALVYTGYEWRARIETSDGVAYKQVFAASEDGTTLNGRMYLADQEESGIDVLARKDDGVTELLSVQPAQLRRGETRELTLVGVALGGKTDFGPGVTVEEVISSNADRLVVRVSAAATATSGPRSVTVGADKLDNAFTVYERVDRLEVSPAYAVGRVGGDGGSQPIVRATYEALAWANGDDGQPGTADDIAIGPMAADWSVEPWDEKAAADNDVKFAGVMDKDAGVFTPGLAGPNPERKYQTNNAGNLRVVATLAEGAETLRGEGRLLVTVQRWNNPPIH